MATELSELTNLLKVQNQNNNSNFRNLENAIESSFLRMSNSLSGIRTIEEQQVSILKDSASKELLEEQLIEKDIARGDKEIIFSLNEIYQVLNRQFDFSRDSENKRKLTEHVQKDFQEKSPLIELGGVENLLRKLIEATEEAGSRSTSEIQNIAEGLGVTSLLGVLKDIAFKLGGFILRNPLLAAGAAGIGMGASGGSGSLTGSVLTGAVTGAAMGGLPGAVAGGAVGAVGWGAGRILNRERDSDPRIGRWEDSKKESSGSKDSSNMKDVWKMAKETERKTGVPAELTVAQFGLESSYGKRMPKGSNNPFGIKARKGEESVEAMTSEFEGGKMIKKPQKFRKFESLQDAFDAHAKLISSNKRYSEVMKAKSPEEIAEAIGKSGYATDPKYKEKILSTMKSKTFNVGRDGKESDDTVNVKTDSLDKDSKPQNMVDVSDLRVKGGLKGQAFKGGETEEGLLNLARTIQAQEKDLPGGLNRFSSFNDAYHLKANPKSKHTQGLALDFSLKDSKYSSEASNYVKEQLINSGLSEKDFKIINEYKNPSKHATGGHIHVNFANKEAAERYAAITKGEKVSPTEEKKTYAKADEKELPEGKGYSEEESEMEEIDEPILREESQERSKESSLVKAKESQLTNFGVTPINQQNPLGGIIQPTGGGIFGGVGQQNPFAALQGILGGIGSAVSMGQNMGNMGSMGGIYGAQGAIGGMQGVLGSLGMQSPALGKVGQAMGSIGNVMSSVQTAKNMGSIGGGGILGGINAASGAIGAAGNIFNAVQGLGSIFGGESSQKTGNMINDNPALKGMADTVGDFFGIRSVGKDRTDDLSDPSKWHPIESKGIGDDAAAVKSKYDSASLMPSVSTDGFSLEGTTKSVETGKEEMMMPSSGEGQSPVVINSGGGGGAGGGGGNSQSNPSSAGVMGIDVGVRNEEATLLRAQYGSVRIV